MLIFADYFRFIKQLLFSHIHHPTDLVKTDYFTEISTNTKINNLSDLYNICQTHKDFRSISVEVSDYRQTDFRLAEGFGKQLRFPSGIRRQNLFLPRKTAGFKAFLLMEPAVSATVSTRRNLDFDERCRFCRHLQEKSKRLLLFIFL